MDRYNNIRHGTIYVINLHTEQTKNYKIINQVFGTKYKLLHLNVTAAILIPNALEVVT